MIKIRDNIKNIDISKLKEYEKNNKIHTQEQISLLVQIIDRFGFTTPLLIDKDYNIIAGHGRKLAGERLGMKKLPCILIDDLSEDEIKTLRIADNRIGELAETSFINIQEEYLSLKESGSGIEFLTGYTEEDFDFLTDGDTNEVEEDDFEVPEDVEEIKTDIKQGDIIQLGNHRLMCGDSTKEEDVSLLMNGNKVNMILTDPPYGMNLDTDYSKMSGNEGKGKKYEIGLVDTFHPNMIKILLNIDCEEVFIFGADYFSEHIENKNKGSWIIWDKRESNETSKNVDNRFGSMFEMCWSKKPHRREIIRYMWAGMMKQSDYDKERKHPTQKPARLMGIFIEKWSKEKDIVLDLFGGSGSTLIACEQLNRVCYMMELDPKYCEVICQRWEKLTNKQRVKLN